MKMGTTRVGTTMVVRSVLVLVGMVYTNGATGDDYNGPCDEGCAATSSSENVPRATTSVPTNTPFAKPLIDAFQQVFRNLNLDWDQFRIVGRPLKASSVNLGDYALARKLHEFLSRFSCQSIC